MPLMREALRIILVYLKKKKGNDTYGRLKPSGAMSLFAIVIVPTGPTVSAKVAVSHIRRGVNGSFSNILSGEQARHSESSTRCKLTR